ncbi:GNAT family N-acetyltransferase [Elizabethkingia meningoseptica]|uniref:N-acetyltransferase n=1 Tax=Elizabethkingia meningoseptica TaxID=238 RepID=A0A1V3U293_ELIME|nr:MULTISPECIES: GNAT family N-acetyltransferase [Elizabethkingia]AQX05849.1 phosphinothricin acetyltransferase [Elizabethkingia meningoseptica]AQX13387.1 phosphinothricin acetyltransferase [Elizabethkingia meningoseptica]AQX47893.1 phosphinothricin acetyltransferase [Elizabethkingia meningoseptica]EJK5327722.1 N-acetyltransferase [Elizabethkingia meningoseptica]EOR29972.1 phosphinothricin N-acetyltransferase [Elizabethkingia meningoseptica ATCC 13253 = NBRC 12535]
MDNFEIRNMQESDGQSVLDIFIEGIEGKNATFEENAPTWEAWKINHYESCRLVITDDQSKILGWAALSPVSKRPCFSGVAEVSIYLTEAVKGQGLGTLLLKRLVNESEENGFWTLQSGIFPENKASLNTHQKCGFRIVGTREKFGKMPDGVWRDIILVERRKED